MGNPQALLRILLDSELEEISSISATEKPNQKEGESAKPKVVLKIYKSKTLLVLFVQETLKASYCG
jgi:hypothetical protein